MPPVNVWSDPAKGCEVPMPRWAVAAREGMDRMKRLTTALPLSESLRGSFKLFNECGLRVTVSLESDSQREGLLISGRSERDYAFYEFLTFIAILSGGGVIEGLYNSSTRDFIDIVNKIINVIIKNPKDDSTQAFVRSLNAAIIQYRKDISGLIRTKDGRSLVGIRTTLGVSPIDYRDAALGADVCIAVSILNPLAWKLTRDDRNLLADLIEFNDLEQVREYASLIRRTARSPTINRLDLMRKLEMACPAAVEMLHVQSEIPEKASPTRYTIELASSGSIQPETQTARTEREDAEYLRLNFPLLYKLMKGPTEEQARREYSLALRRLIHHGVSPEFIQECIAEGFRDISAIEALYTASPHEGATTAKVRCPVPPDLSGQGQPDEVVAPLSPLFISYDDFLRGITFSQEIQDHIHVNGNGLTHTDIVFALCKGFNLGSKKAAVGGSHFRGSLIRKNMRRCGLDDGEVIAFLDSLNLIIHHGGSARTKDDAMSINIHPDNGIGKEIVRTISDAFLRLRQAGRANRASGTKTNGTMREL